LFDDRAQRAVACWECEATTASPVTVLLASPAGTIGRLSLCPLCYDACYRPLASQAVDPVSQVYALLIVDPDATRPGH
jgi:hypothetical protein